MGRAEYLKEWRRKNPEKLREYSRRWRKKQPDKLKDRCKEYWRANYLSTTDENGNYIRLKVKKRPRPNDICELCGRNIRRLSYHHWDGKNPQHGLWLCGTCHHFAGVADKGLHNKYLELKSKLVL